MKRIFFALHFGWKNRKALKRFLVDRSRQIYDLKEITPEKLDNAGIAILILDFDGVLAYHDAPVPSKEAITWLTDLCSKIGEQRIALLTNKPKESRLHFFREKFPSIHIVQGVRKKPYPDGILEVAQYRNVAPHRILLLDDRLLTGMLATCLAYSQGWYFRYPVVNLAKKPIKELFFMSLRGFERIFVRLIGNI